MLNVLGLAAGLGFFAAPLGAAEPADLFPIAVTVGQWKGTPLDMGALNAPLRAPDRAAVAGGRFVRVGADGKAGTADDRPLKFFGVNLSFSANFPAAAQSKQLAADLSALGVNIVRLHHFDTRYADAVSGSVSGVLRRGKFPSFDETALQRMRQLIVDLAAAGIYVDLNLHVGYGFDVVRDELKSLPSGFVFPPKSKPYQIVVPELWKRQEEYACGLIERLDLKRSPFLAIVEINNESSLIFSWQRGELDGPAAEPILTPAWRAFRREKGWSDARGIVSFGRGSAEDKARFAEFLIAQDAAYLTAMRAAVKNCAGAEVAVTGTQMSHGGLAVQHASRAMDFIDTHFYADHYQYPKGHKRDGWWWINDSSLAVNRFYPLDGVLTLRRAGLPFTISEYNQPWPNRQGHEIDVTVAALGLIQGWDGLMHFNYANDDTYDRGYPRGFNLAGDPARMSVFGQAAKLFRAEEVTAPAIRLVFTEADAARFAAAGMEQRRMGKVVGNVFGIDTSMLLNSRVSSAIGAKRTLEREAAFRPAEVRFEPDRQAVDVRTGSVWVSSGKVAGKKVGSADFSLTFPRKAPAFALAVLSSLDGVQVSRARRLLLTVPGPTLRSVYSASGVASPEYLMPARKGWTLPPGDTSRPSALLQEGRGPVWMERLPVVVGLRLAPGRLTVYPLAGDGTRMAALPNTLVTATKEGYTIDLTPLGARATPWYELDIVEETRR